ncbi:MAG: ketosteroid isomerase-like protein [Limisphaerales bacterium]|jgi:ketosteroid isomerase-like protein
MRKNMNDLQRIEIEATCSRLVTAYCHYVDHGEASRVADLFTEDGIWASAENTMRGRAAIREGFQARQDNKARMSRHVCNNFHLHTVTESTAKGTVYLTLYRHDGAQDRQTSPLPGPLLVGEYQDQFVLTDEGWRISERTVKVDFVRRSKDN